MGRICSSQCRETDSKLARRICPALGECWCVQRTSWSTWTKATRTFGPSSRAVPTCLVTARACSCAQLRTRCATSSSSLLNLSMETSTRCAHPDQYPYSCTIVSTDTHKRWGAHVYTKLVYRMTSKSSYVFSITRSRESRDTISDAWSERRVVITLLLSTQGHQCLACCCSRSCFKTLIKKWLFEVVVIKNKGLFAHPSNRHAHLTCWLFIEVCTCTSLDILYVF